MVEQMKLFLASVSFLSIMPTGINRRLSADKLAASAVYFPAAGLLIGTMALFLALALDRVLAPPAADALLVLFLTVTTGGLHLDALADTIDGFAGGESKAARLKIMRQGASGPFGVSAVTLVLLLKYAFLSALAGPVRLLALLTVPGMARWPMVWLAWLLPPARRGGLGRLFAQRTRWFDTAGAGLQATGVCIYLAWLLNPGYLLLLPLLLALALLSAWLSKALLGGVTGDTLGATVELSEVVLLAAINLVARYA